MGSDPSRHELVSILQGGKSEARSLPLEDLRKITNDFSDEQLLGEGGFGKVYKGVLQTGDIIAVKKLVSSMPGVHDKQFENEAHHLMRLKHPNIVQLVGYCSETENIPVQYNGKFVYAEKSERLLCLEYLPNGSLCEHLSDESSGLDWGARYRIIEGVCSGLHYLHEGWQVNTPIIHMDLKPANILLDDNMVPKIADFGLSRLFGNEKTRTCTQSRDGTLGYMAPEYINRGIITKKLDIFSLGVIIIQIVTGRKDDYPDESGTSSQEFIDLVIKKWRNRLEKTPWYISLEMDCQQIRRCIEIGLVCVKLDRAQRPTIGQIIKMLQGSKNADFRDGKVLKPLANEVPTHLANTSSSLEKDGQPKRRFLFDLNCVETDPIGTSAVNMAQVPIHLANMSSSLEKDVHPKRRLLELNRMEADPMEGSDLGRITVTWGGTRSRSLMGYSPSSASLAGAAIGPLFLPAVSSSLTLSAPSSTSPAGAAVGLQFLPSGTFSSAPFETASMLTSVTKTVNGSHHFKICGYSLSKGIGVGKYIASETFFVGGFEWAIYFYPDGKNTEDGAAYISLFIALVSEATDVRALFEIMLIDQSGKGQDKVLEGGPYTLKYRGSMWGYKRFFKRSALETSEYLKDDCLLVNCNVGVVQSQY